MTKITINCKSCDWTFTGSEYDSELAFDRHCDEVHPEIFCKVCGKIFGTERGLKIHMGRTDCSKRATIALKGSIENIIDQQMADEFDKSEHEAQNPEASCLCGCGQAVAGKRIFRQGHDMKLKSQIKNGAILTGAQAEYANLMWNSFFLKYK